MKLTIKFSQFTVKNHTLQSRCLGRTGWQNGVAYCRDMLQPGKLHVSLRTRSQALPTVARLCCRVSSTRFAVILSFFVSSILVLEAKTSVVTNEGNYEEESKLEYDDDSSVKRLIKASLKRPEIRGPALVPVADIPGVWTCSLEFESGDAEKWTLWKRCVCARACACAWVFATREETGLIRVPRRPQDGGRNTPSVPSLEVALHYQIYVDVRNSDTSRNAGALLSGRTNGFKCQSR